MVRQLQPTSVWCYGERIPEHLHKLVEIQTYKPWQLQLRAIDERKKQAAIAAPDVAKMPRLPEG